MRFAFALRHRRGLLMQPHPSHSSPYASSSSGSLKRAHGQQALASSQATPSTMNQTESGGLTPSSSSDSSSRRPAKAPKVDSRQPFSTAAAAVSHSYRGRPSRPTNNPKSHFVGFGLSTKKSGKQSAKSSKRLPVLSEPVHSKEYVERTYRSPSSSIKQSWLDNPKSTLHNISVMRGTRQPRFIAQEMLGPDGKSIWRCGSQQLRRKCY